MVGWIGHIDDFGWGAEQKLFKVFKISCKMYFETFNIELMENKEGLVD